MRIDRDSYVVRFMPVDADDDLVHGCPFAGMAPGTDREDRIVKVRDRQAPMRSHLPRCRGNLMVDRSTQ